MKKQFHVPPHAGFRILIVFAAASLMVFACGFSAQQPSTTSQDTQREAMSKLAFLVGHWSGPVTVVRGPGEPLRLTQTENVEFKLDDLVLLVQGQSTAPDGKAQFKALATISFDDAAHAYRFRAYNDGHYIDTELTVQPASFSWGFTAGPAHVVNTMELTAKHEWHEVTEVTLGDAPPRKSVEMLLRHEP